VYVENLICNGVQPDLGARAGRGSRRRVVPVHPLAPSGSSCLAPVELYFAVRLWWAQRRAEALRWGDLVSVLGAIRARGTLWTSIRVAQVRGSHWEFASMSGGWAGDPPHITFIIRGVVFIVTRLPKDTDVPWPSVELEAGVTRSKLPILKGAELRDLFDIDRPRAADLTPDVART
jgi:hypothetical protein